MRIRTRHWHRIVMITVATMALSGCLTSMMYQHDMVQEKLSSVLISQDGEDLIAITDRHDYIFRDTPRIAKIVSGDLDDHANAYFMGFKARGNAITGKLSIRLEQLPQNLEAQALQLGFTRNGQGDYTTSIPLRGTIYERAPHSLPTRYTLNRTYTVTIEQIPSPLSTAGKVLATPVTVAADGAMFLAGVALIVITTPFRDTYW